MAGSVRYVTTRVTLTGSVAPIALEEAGLVPGRSLELGDGASASRPILLSETPIEILNIVADVATITASVATLAHWLHKLSRRKGVVIERIGRTTIERVTENEIVRVLHEEIRREVEDREST